MRMAHVLGSARWISTSGTCVWSRRSADAGSMTRAADRLHLTQSALSHQLRDIEARFGTPFFVRLGRTHGAHGGRTARPRDRAPRPRRDRARRGGRPAAGGTCRRHHPRLHAVQHRLSLAGAAAAAFQRQASSRDGAHRRRRDRSSGRRPDRGPRRSRAADRSAPPTAACACGRCSPTRWSRSSPRAIRSRAIAGCLRRRWRRAPADLLERPGRELRLSARAGPARARRRGASPSSC